MPIVIKTIGAPTPVLPIDSLSVGCCKLLCDREIYCSIGNIRNLLTIFARENPEIASLARGNIGGGRAEFISVNIRKLIK